MTRTIVTRRIKAPLERVFTAIADPQTFCEIVPGVTKIEYKTAQRSGVGTRFVETRVMKGREASTELKVTEHAPNERIRLVADSHGTVWDTVFTVRAQGEITELKMVMDAKAHRLLPKLINPLIKGMVQKVIEQDMDDVKAWCEKS